MSDLRFRFAATTLVTLVAIACGAADSKKKPPRDLDDAGSGGRASGTGGRAGAGGSAVGGSGGSSGGSAVGGSGGSSGGGAAGGSGGSSGGGGMDGAAGGTDAGAGGASPLDSSADGPGGADSGDAGGGLTACDTPADPCCSGGVCATDLFCAGLACTCTESVQGDHVIRADGRLIEVQGSQTPIRDQTTGNVLTGVTSAFNAHWHGCASRSDGSVWCWPTSTPEGNNNGQLGNGTTGGTLTLNLATQVQTPPGTDGGPAEYLSGIVSLQDSFTGYLSSPTCAVKNDGTLWCWGSLGGGGGSVNLQQTGGDNPYAHPILASAATPVTDAVQVAVGSRHACYVTTAKEVYCWGMNVGGSLGNGTQTASLYPVRALGLTGVQKVVTGPDYTCALVSEGADLGRVRCWGSTGAGMVGIGPPAADTDGCINFCKTTPARVRTSATAYLENVVDIAAGYQTVCALHADRTVSCWGTLGDVWAVPLDVQGTPVAGVSRLAIHSGEARLLFTDGTYARVTSSQTVFNVNCGLLD